MLLPISQEDSRMDDLVGRLEDALAETCPPGSRWLNALIRSADLREAIKALSALKGGDGSANASLPPTPESADAGAEPSAAEEALYAIRNQLSYAKRAAKSESGEGH